MYNKKGALAPLFILVLLLFRQFVFVVLLLPLSIMQLFFHILQLDIHYPSL